MNGAAHGGFVLLPVVLALSLLAVISWLLNREGAMGIESGGDGSRAQLARYAAEAGLAYATKRIGDLDCATPPATLSVDLGGGRSATMAVSALANGAYPVTATGVAGDATRVLSDQIVPYDTTVYSTSVVRMRSRDYASVADTLIAADGPTYNFGRDQYLVVDNSSGGTTNTLLYFNVANAGLSAQAKLRSATLTLTRTPYTAKGGSAAIPFGVRKLTRAWHEGIGSGVIGPRNAQTTSSNSQAEATYVQAVSTPTTVAWSAAPTGQTALGIGDADLLIDQPTYTIATIGNGVSPLPTLSFDLTPAVAEWLADPTTNLGVLLEADAPVAKVPFWSSDSATASQWPVLSIAYQLPCGAYPPPTADVALTQPAIQAGAATVVTFTIQNWAAVALSGVSLNVSLPSGVSLTDTPATTCGGTLSTSSSAGIASLQLSGGAIAAAPGGGVPSTCLVSVAIGSSTIGSYTVAAGAGSVGSSVGSNTDTSSDVLAVGQALPWAVLDLPMAPSAWASQNLVITLENPGSTSVNLTGNLNDVLPSGFTASTVSTTCGGGPSISGQTVSLGGGTIPAGTVSNPGTCTVSAKLAAVTPGAYQDSLAAGSLVTTAGASIVGSTLATYVPAKDAGISSPNQTLNYGASTTVRVDEKNGPWRLLVQFDVSAIPATAVIRNAKLRVDVTSIVNPGAPWPVLQAYALTESWVEGTLVGLANVNGADWRYRDIANALSWTRSGAVPNGASALASATVSATGWVELDITGIVQNWVSGASGNFGLALENQNTGANANNNQLIVNTRESGAPPQLVVTW